MSFIPKLQTALSVAFILTTAGVISVAAQSQAAPENSASNAAAVAPATSEPKKAESKKQTAAPAENAVSDKASEVSREADNSRVTTASGAGKAEESPAATTAPRSPQAVDPDKWQFQVTPYFWLESLHGNAGLGNRTAQVDQSFSDLFHDLDFFIMGAFEARKGKLVSLTTMEYTDISDDKATPGPFFSDAKANFKQFIFDSEVGYRLYDDPDKGSSVDVLGGIRVWHVSTELNFGAGILPAVNVDGSRNWVDAVAGLRGKAALSKKVFLTGKFDVGGGGSKFTYQVFGGAGYNLTPKIALIGGYRVLDVDYNKNNFVYDMNQRGPIFGLGFKF